LIDFFRATFALAERDVVHDRREKRLSKKNTEDGGVSTILFRSGLQRMRNFVLHGIKSWVFTDNDMVDNFYVEELCAFNNQLCD
jgi:hypothetical protein